MKNNNEERDPSEQEVREADKSDLELVKEYREKGKLSENFDEVPIMKYRAVNCGRPYPPDHGELIATAWGGSDAEGNLLPGNGEWCKVSDVKKLIMIMKKRLSKEAMDDIEKEIDVLFLD